MKNTTEINKIKEINNKFIIEDTLDEFFIRQEIKIKRVRVVMNLSVIFIIITFVYFGISNQNSVLSKLLKHFF